MCSNYIEVNYNPGLLDIDLYLEGGNLFCSFQSRICESDLSSSELVANHDLPRTAVEQAATIPQHEKVKTLFLFET